MADRKKLVAGNWKMNGLRGDGAALAGDLARRAQALAGGPPCELLLCPPATLLSLVGAALAGSGVALGGQDCRAERQGAYTGDISAEMLADAGCTHVILGHSERRREHGESDADIRLKMLAAARAGLAAILCVGETLPQREAGNAVDVVARQLAGSIPEDAAVDRLIIAYEPVWAIGTGRSATGDDIAAMHQAIRARLSHETRILYGGSVNPTNAAALLASAEVDGALVGGASLNADDFWAIACCCG
jgi:triosephosphate isomerase (TIM)